MKRFRLVFAAAVAVGVMAAAPVAQAAENCVGAEGVAVFCADPLGRVIYSTCVYTGDPTCQPVVVPGPDLTRCDIGPNNPQSLVIEVIEGYCESL